MRLAEAAYLPLADGYRWQQPGHSQRMCTKAQLQKPLDKLLLVLKALGAARWPVERLRDTMVTRTMRGLPADQVAWLKALRLDEAAAKQADGLEMAAYASLAAVLSPPLPDDEAVEQLIVGFTRFAAGIYSRLEVSRWARNAWKRLPPTERMRDKALSLVVWRTRLLQGHDMKLLRKEFEPQEHFKKGREFEALPMVGGKRCMPAALLCDAWQNLRAGMTIKACDALLFYVQHCQRGQMSTNVPTHEKLPFDGMLDLLELAGALALTGLGQAAGLAYLPDAYITLLERSPLSVPVSGKRLHIDAVFSQQRSVSGAQAIRLLESAISCLHQLPFAMQEVAALVSANANPAAMHDVLRAILVAKYNVPQYMAPWDDGVPDVVPFMAAYEASMVRAALLAASILATLSLGAAPRQGRGRELPAEPAHRLATACWVLLVNAQRAVAAQLEATKFNQAINRMRDARHLEELLRGASSLAASCGCELSEVRADRGPRPWTGFGQRAERQLAASRPRWPYTPVMDLEFRRPAPAAPDLQMYPEEVDPNEVRARAALLIQQEWRMYLLRRQRKRDTYRLRYNPMANRLAARWREWYRAQRRAQEEAAAAAELERQRREAQQAQQAGFRTRLAWVDEEADRPTHSDADCRVCPPPPPQPPPGLGWSEQGTPGAAPPGLATPPASPGLLPPGMPAGGLLVSPQYANGAAGLYAAYPLYGGMMSPAGYYGAGPQYAQGYQPADYPAAAPGLPYSPQVGAAYPAALAYQQGPLSPGGYAAPQQVPLQYAQYAQYGQYASYPQGMPPASPQYVAQPDSQYYPQYPPSPGDAGGSSLQADAAEFVPHVFTEQHKQNLEALRDYARLYKDFVCPVLGEHEAVKLRLDDLSTSQEHTSWGPGADMQLDDLQIRLDMFVTRLEDVLKHLDATRNWAAAPEWVLPRLDELEAGVREAQAWLEAGARGGSPEAADAGAPEAGSQEAGDGDVAAQVADEASWVEELDHPAEASHAEAEEEQWEVFQSKQTRRRGGGRRQQQAARGARAGGPGNGNNQAAGGGNAGARRGRRA